MARAAIVSKRLSRRDARALHDMIDELREQVATLQERLSVAEGRSSMNAERVVRTHSSVQNIAEDLEPLSRQVRTLMRERKAQQADREDS